MRGISCYSMRNQLLRSMFLIVNRLGSTCGGGGEECRRIHRARQTVRLEVLESEPLTCCVKLARDEAGKARLRLLEQIATVPTARRPTAWRHREHHRLSYLTGDQTPGPIWIFRQTINIISQALLLSDRVRVACTRTFPTASAKPRSQNPRPANMA